jgi:hypothetical protein
MFDVEKRFNREEDWVARDHRNATGIKLMPKARLALQSVVRKWTLVSEIDHPAPQQKLHSDVQPLSAQ